MFKTSFYIAFCCCQSRFARLTGPTHEKTVDFYANVSVTVCVTALISVTQTVTQSFTKEAVCFYA